MYNRKLNNQFSDILQKENLYKLNMSFNKSLNSVDRLTKNIFVADELLLTESLNNETAFFETGGIPGFSSKILTFLKNFDYSYFFFDELDFADLPEAKLHNLSSSERLALVDYLTFSGWYIELKRFLDKREISERTFFNMRPLEYLYKVRLGNFNDSKKKISIETVMPENFRLKDYIALSKHYSFLEHYAIIQAKLLNFRNKKELNDFVQIVHNLGRKEILNLFIKVKNKELSVEELRTKICCFVDDYKADFVNKQQFSDFKFFYLKNKKFDDSVSLNSLMQEDLLINTSEHSFNLLNFLHRYYYFQSYGAERLNLYDNYNLFLKNIGAYERKTRINQDFHNFPSDAVVSLNFSKTRYISDMDSSIRKFFIFKDKYKSFFLSFLNKKFVTNQNFLESEKFSMQQKLLRFLFLKELNQNYNSKEARGLNSLLSKNNTILFFNGGSLRKKLYLPKQKAIRSSLERFKKPSYNSEVDFSILNYDNTEFISKYNLLYNLNKNVSGKKGLVKFDGTKKGLVVFDLLVSAPLNNFNKFIINSINLNNNKNSLIYRLKKQEFSNLINTFREDSINELFAEDNLFNSIYKNSKISKEYIISKKLIEYDFLTLQNTLMANLYKKIKLSENQLNLLNKTNYSTFYYHNKIYKLNLFLKNRNIEGYQNKYKEVFNFTQLCLRRGLSKRAVIKLINFKYPYFLKYEYFPNNINSFNFSGFDFNDPKMGIENYFKLLSQLDNKNIQKQSFEYLLNDLLFGYDYSFQDALNEISFKETESYYDLENQDSDYFLNLDVSQILEFYRIFAKENLYSDFSKKIFF